MQPLLDDLSLRRKERLNAKTLTYRPFAVRLLAERSCLGYRRIVRAHCTRDALCLHFCTFEEAPHVLHLLPSLPRSRNISCVNLSAATIVTSNSFWAIAMEDDDFNSSDIELPEAQPNPHAHRGAQSIESMIKSAFQDRRESKIQSKMLQHGAGAPGTVVARNIWSNRFDWFRTHTLNKK
jgi:hypothetical protein